MASTSYPANQGSYPSGIPFHREAYHEGECRIDIESLKARLSKKEDCESRLKEDCEPGAGHRGFSGQLVTLVSSNMRGLFGVARLQKPARTI